MGRRISRAFLSVFRLPELLPEAVARRFANGLRLRKRLRYLLALFEMGVLKRGIRRGAVRKRVGDSPVAGPDAGSRFGNAWSEMQDNRNFG